MSLLAKAESSKKKRPYFIALYGQSGLGKSTFGAEAPNPIFIDTEKGLAHLDVKAFQPESYDQVLAFVDELLNTKHNYETLVIDTLDHMETLVFREVCKSQEKNHIEDISYKRGYIFAVDEWRKLTSKLSLLREKMNVVLLAHSITKNEKNPMGEDYIRYQLKIHEKAAALITEVVDALLFTSYEVFTKKIDGKTKGFGEGARVVHTESRPGFHAKNRYSLPETLSLSWGDFVTASEGTEDPSIVKAKITEHLDAIKDDELTKKVLEYTKDADFIKLKKTEDKLALRRGALAHA